MFEDSLLESGGRLKKRNPWATAMSFALEGLAIGLLVLVPMIYTEALPVHALFDTTQVFAPPTREAPRGPERPIERQHAKPQTEVIDSTMVQPGSIPKKTVYVDDIDERRYAVGNSPVDDCQGCIIGTGNRSSNLIAEVMRPRPIAVPDQAIPSVIRRSEGVMTGLLIHQVKPAYPPLALKARIQGSVVLTATIGRDGTIQNLAVASGHPMLITAAVDAVKQWRYRPFLLNGQPVDVETSVTVNFNLN